ncbi:MAG: acyltransferase [Bacteroidetes bacterium]|nr:MAG: acyltransferase [Bacteroidota bacterium]
MNTHKPFLSLRFFFVLGIFFANMNFTDIHLPDSFVWLRKTFLAEGWLGMSYFFKLAGFMVGYHYLKNLSSFKASTFLLKEASTLYPIHWITMLIAVPFSLEILGEDKLKWVLIFLSNASLIHTLIPAKDFFMSFNIPAWTYSNEMFFYFLFPLIAWMLLKAPRIIIGLWIALMIGIVITMEVVYKEFNTEMWYLFFFNPWFNLAEFGLGIFVAYLYFQAKDKLFFQLPYNVTWLEITSILLLLVFFIFRGSVLQIYRFSYYYWIPLSYLIFAFSFQRGRISAFLSRKPFIFLGEMAMSFYLLHLSVRGYGTFFNRKTHLLEDVYVRIVVLFVVSFVLAVLFHRYVEKPINVLISKWLKTDDAHGSEHLATGNSHIAKLPPGREAADTTHNG